MNGVASRNGRPRVLVLSRSYPNRVQPVLGIWVRQLVADSRAFAEPKVVAPAPWCPPVPRLPPDISVYRDIERSADDDGVEVLHPRFLVAPGARLAATEAGAYLARVLPLAARLRRRFAFDLVHAHFTYPDGVVAAALGRRYGVPVVITEQAPWGPWLDGSPLVRRQMVWAARRATFQIAISTEVKSSIERLAGPLPQLRIVPDAVDGSVFTLPPDGTRKVRNRVLYVGSIRHVKGFDVLLHAIRHLADRGVDVELHAIGEGYFRAYREYQDGMVRLSHELGISDRVHFAGRKPLRELVAAMQESAVLVLPSRHESLGMVLVEALACGTPVVATRCGGPEDIVDDDVGLLVPPEDPAALADGLAQTLGALDRYEPAVLRERTLARFGSRAISERLSALYREALAGGP
jgi:glycosyltransferase involved in cell wall biosynthesis